MDVLRSCYSSTWTLPGLGDVAGGFYFADPAAPFYDDWTYYASRNWIHNDGIDFAGYGERHDVKQKWRNGAWPAGRPALVTVGTARCIGGFEEMHAAASPLYGLPAACWPGARVGRGGVQVDGSADLAGRLYFAGAGGVQVDGSAKGPAAGLAGEGGVKVDGSADLAGRVYLAGYGGVLIDGAALTYRPGLLVATGGVLLDGASVTGVSLAFTGAGGVQVDGAAALARGPTLQPSGGVKIDGQGIFSHTAAAAFGGGVLADGAAGLSGGRVLAGNGGILADGSAALFRYLNLAGAGGVKVDGSADLAGRRALEGAGGVKIDGAADMALTHYPHRAIVQHAESIVLAGAPLVRFSIQGVAVDNVWSFQNVAALNDEFVNGFFLAAGDYDMSVIGQSGPGCAIVTWTIDGVAQAPGQDWWRANPVDNDRRTLRVSVLTSGYHVLNGKVTGRNASATAWNLRLSRISFVPLAETVDAG